MNVTTNFIIYLLINLLNFLVDNLKECILEIINNIKDENIMDFIDEMKVQNSKNYLNYFINITIKVYKARNILKDSFLVLRKLKIYWNMFSIINTIELLKMILKKLRIIHIPIMMIWLSSWKKRKLNYCKLFIIMISLKMINLW